MTITMFLAQVAAAVVGTLIGRWLANRLLKLNP